MLAVTVLSATACSDGGPGDGASDSTESGTSVVTATRETVPPEPETAVTPPDTTSTGRTTPETTPIETTSPVATVPDTSSTSPTTTAVDGSGESDGSAPRPIAAVVSVDEDGCRFASSLVTLDPADLALPDDVEANEDALITGTGTVSDEASPDGCEGTIATVTFTAVDRVVDVSRGGQTEPTVSELQSVVFDQPWECGRGFTMSDAEHAWAVTIDAAAGNVTEAAGDRVTIPDERFNVVVAYGVDLSAGNCALERAPFDPATVMLAIWPVTEGSFVYPDATVICDGSSASTELVDAVVETPEGPVELPPIEMVNPAFACGPGWDG